MILVLGGLRVAAGRAEHFRCFPEVLSVATEDPAIFSEDCVSVRTVFFDVHFGDAAAPAAFGGRDFENIEVSVTLIAFGHALHGRFVPATACEMIQLLALEACFPIHGASP